MTTYSETFIDEHRRINVDYDWWGSTYDDFRSVCAILGIDLNKHEPSFSGFWCQGDGASFTGTYHAAKHYVPASYYDTAPAKIREHAPEDTVLHEIADALHVLACQYWPVYAPIERGYGSHYVHSNTMTIGNIEPVDDGAIDELPDAIYVAVEEVLKTQMRALADWLYGILDKEYEYLTSDEAVVETLEANDMQEEEVEDEEVYA